MLKELHELDCRILWPGNWEDIGFTEHQIWVNGKGYGYFACDEPNITYEVERIPDEKWKEIRDKITAGTLTIEDIEGTSLEEMVFFEDDEAFSSEWLKGLLTLPKVLGDSFYCADSWDGPCFFNTKEEFLNFLRRDECDYTWEELEDEVLALWIERLHNGELEWFA